MIACPVIDIGPNITSILVLAGPALTAVVLAYAARLRAAVKRTESTVDATHATVTSLAAGVADAAAAAVAPPDLTGPTDIRNRPIGG